MGYQIHSDIVFAIKVHIDGILQDTDSVLGLLNHIKSLTYDKDRDLINIYQNHIRDTGDMDIFYSLLDLDIKSKGDIRSFSIRRENDEIHIYFIIDSSAYNAGFNSEDLSLNCFSRKINIRTDYSTASSVIKNELRELLDDWHLVPQVGIYQLFDIF